MHAALWTEQARPGEPPRSRQRQAADRRPGGRLRVALVSEHASPLTEPGEVDAGGQNVHVAALASALAAAGHQVVVHTRRTSPAQPDRVVTVDGVAVEHVDAGPAVPVPKDELVPLMADFGRELGAAWSRWRPDVVHAHFWMSGLASLAAARPLGVPVVQTFHALGVVKRREQGDRDTSPPERLQVEASIAAEVDRIVATCADEVAELVAMGAPADRITVAPCGVDLDRFRPDGPAAVRPAGVPRLLILGRLVPRKGVDTAIRALAGVPGAELVVAGGPPVEHLDSDPEATRLVEVAAAAGVADRVRLVGRVARAEVPALIRSADLVVCTPWYEPFGIVPLEAMACGVPVVARPVGGLAETVRHGVTGLLVDDRDPDALAAALTTLLGDDGRRARMGRAARRRAVDCYSWRRVAALTAEAYATALVGSSAA